MLGDILDTTDVYQDFFGDNMMLVSNNIQKVQKSCFLEEYYRNNFYIKFSKENVFVALQIQWEK